MNLCRACNAIDHGDETLILCPRNPINSAANHGKEACKCGEFDHQRTSYSLCRLNVKRTLANQVTKNNYIYLFWWKNLDIDSNLYNLKKRTKKDSLILRNISKPEKTLLLNPTAALGSNSPTNTTKHILTFFLAESFSPRSIYPESEKKVKKTSLGFWTFRHT